ncbi:spore germination protein [Bacillus sp. RG28]|uniref:Spore germination protein n=1 Tax=Gottfriedia endophytica TaxID=2820819 RepID=A0A940SKQ6_9BACI|nr:spore germination protein [Gottfriedia endophytica]MBP0725508.1 spore germination protein [Gottfriedia endophytica]
MEFRTLQNNSDFQNRSLRKYEKIITFYYLSSVCDEDKINKLIIKPFYEFEQFNIYKNYLETLQGWEIVTEESIMVEKILDGSIIINLDEKNYSVSVSNFSTSAVAESIEENVLQGPKDGLNEKIDTSINLIRNRYRKSTLKVENYIVGNLSKTKVVFLYDRDLIDSKVYNNLKGKIKGLSVEVLQSCGQLQKLLINKKWTLFPLFLTTERPDRIVKNISSGKIIMLVEGSPWALIGPASFFDFFKSMDDSVELSLVAKFLVFIRFIALLNTLLLPAIYVAIISYSPEILQVQFALLIAGSRISVPFPSYIEILFLMLMAEFLTEASIRLPKSISSSATTVGGLILGQTASQAGLVADVMIIVVSLVALSLFIIPINAMHQAIRVVRYPIIILASLFGMLGVIVSVLAILCYLCNLRSLGKPYLTLFNNN